MDTQQHDEAFKCYSAALSIHPANTHRSTILRSKVSMAQKLWDDAVDHANEVRAPLSCKVLVSRREHRRSHSIHRHRGGMA